VHPSCQTLGVFKRLVSNFFRGAACFCIGLLRQIDRMKFQAALVHRYRTLSYELRMPNECEAVQSVAPRGPSRRRR
jgi:hypothetical protein